MSSSEESKGNSPVKPNLTGGQRWRRRIKRTLIVLIVLLIVARLALILILPSAIRKASEYYGLRTEYGRAKLGLLGGYAAIWDVKITPAEGGEPVATANFCEAAISPWALLRGKLIIWRVGADGVNANIERSADGRIALLEKFASPPAEVAPATEPGPPTELDLTAPLQVEALRLSGMRAHIKDLSVSPPFEGIIQVGIRVSDIGNVDRPASVEIDLQSEGILEDLRLAGTAQSQGRNLQADLSLIGRGLSFGNLRGYLAPMGLDSGRQALDISGRLTVVTSAVEGTLDALKGEAVLKDVRLYSGQQDALKIGRITATPTYIGPDRLDLGRIEVVDVTAEVQRNQNARFAFGPVELGTSQATAPEVAPAPAISPTTQPLALPNVSLDALETRNVRFDLVDQAIPGTARLSLVLDQLNLANLATQARGEVKPVTISARLSAPGLAGQITVEGEAKPLEERKTAHLNIRVSGIRPDAAKPYLSTAGLESELANGVLNVDLAAAFVKLGSGILKGDITLQDLSLTDSKTLLKLADCRISDCQVDPATGAVEVGAIDIAGPHLSLHRDRQGAFSMFGIKTVPGHSAPATPPPAAPAVATPPSSGEAVSFTLPRLSIERFTWKDVRFELADDFIQPAVRAVMTDAGLEIRGLVLDPAATAAPKPASVRAWLKLPGIVEEAGTSGELVIAPHSVELATQSAARGISAKVLAPYLEPAGIIPLFSNGLFQSAEQLAIRPIPGGYSIDTSVANVKLSDGQTLLASLAQLAIQNAQLTAEKTVIGAVKVQEPYIALARDRNGNLEAAGVRVEPRPTESKPLKLPELPRIGVDQLEIKGARVAWSDRTFEPAIATTSTTDVRLSGLRLSEAASPATLTVQSALEGAVKSLSVDALLTTPPGNYELSSTVKVSGITLGSVRGYLPAGTSSALQDGSLSLKLESKLLAREAGGLGAHLAVSDFVYANSGEPLVSFGRASLVAPTVDPDHLEVALEEILLSGLRVNVERSRTGVITAGGLRLAEDPKRPQAVAPATQAHAKPEEEREVSEILAAARKPVPELTVQKLFLGADEIIFTDHARPSAAPLAIRDVQFRNADPFAWLGPKALEQAPGRFEFTARIDPGVGRIVANMELAPFAAQPSADLRLLVDQINGEQLASALPELAGQVDLSTLKSGKLQLKMAATAKVERRGAANFDFARGFTVDYSLSDVQFTDDGSDQVLVGLQSLQAPGIRVEPAKRLITVPSIEIATPRAYLSRSLQGLQIAGVTVRLDAAADADAAQPSPEAAREVSDSAAEQPFDLQISRATISGIDVTFVDNSYDPAVLVPLRQLDMDISDFGTLSLKQPRPIRFNALLASGKTPLSATRQRPAGERELFALATANGAISLYPQPSGWAKASLNGLELIALKGAAKSANVDLAGGVFDGELDLRLTGRADGEVRAKAVMTDLSVSEPSNGPISRALKLPAPLDATLRVLEDADGSITMPIRFGLVEGSISWGDVYRSGAAAVAQTVGVAIASSPLKLAQGASSAFGGEDAEKERPAATITFMPGSAEISAESAQSIDALVGELRNDKNAQLIVRHVLGDADLKIAAMRANPQPDDAQNLAEGLRFRKQQLQRERQELAIRTSTRLASMPETALQGELERIRRLDREIYATDQALSGVLDLFRPGADRQESRRTRAASLGLGQARLDAVKGAILQWNFRNPEQRIHTASPSAQVAVEGESRVTIELVTRKK